MVSGKIDNLSKFFVVINGINHPVENILEAVDKCYIALKTFRSFPPLLEHVWIFFEKLVYCIQGGKSYNMVDTALNNIDKLLGMPKKNLPD